jgi:hypothetical protein
MASPSVFTLAPNPHWVIIDNFSKLPNGAAIYTYRSLDPSQFKPAFQDAGGTIPYDQPITGFGNGTMPPIFWEFDPANPNETYYIRVYDSANTATQNFLWDFNGLSGNSSGSGGGGTVTNNDIENLVVNGTFFRNIGTQTGSPSLPVSLTLAPSNNAGFVGDATNPAGPASPDIIFAKSNTTSGDSLSFPKFTLGSTTFSPDVTPVNYFNYTCSGAGSGETYKYVQFPICQGVQSLSGQTVSVKIYARCNSGNPNLQLVFRQYFGGGGSPSADNTLIVSGGPLPLTSSWQAFTFTGVVLPSASSLNTIGTCGNDGLFLQVQLPLSPATTSIDFVKPAVWLGPVAPSIDFHSNDMIDSIVNSPRTGDTRTSVNSFLPGWLLMNDGTIGGPSSSATTRANTDTFPLFDVIWRQFQANQTLAPMYTSGGAPASYGATSFADFNSSNQISLVRNTGRVMAGAVPVAVSQSFTNTGNVMTVTSTAGFITGQIVLATGAGLPTPLVINTDYFVIVLSSTTLSLAANYAAAIANTPIVLTTNASGTITAFPQHVLGVFQGEETHVQTESEMFPHTHTLSPYTDSTASAGGGVRAFVSSGSLTTSSRGGGAPFNIMQPTVYMNVFIKQ